jgi:hypothetical protein
VGLEVSSEPAEFHKNQLAGRRQGDVIAVLWLSDQGMCLVCVQKFERTICWSPISPGPDDPRQRLDGVATAPLVLPLPAFAFELAAVPDAWEEDSELSWSESPAKAALMDDAASHQGELASLSGPETVR